MIGRFALATHIDHVLRRVVLIRPLSSKTSSGLDLHAKPTKQKDSDIYQKWIAPYLLLSGCLVTGVDIYNTVLHEESNEAN